MWTDEVKIQETTFTPWWAEEAQTLFGNGGEIQYAQNGAKLEEIETSEEKSVIPEGALHKNKNNLDLDITPKGIPVITVEGDDGNISTLEQIKESGEITQHAEIEHNEIIFSRELTDFLEEKRKEWHNGGKESDIFLEVGMRLTKEIMENTDDNTGLIDKMEEKI